MFTDIFIKKPVLSIALSFAIILVGILSAAKMPIRQFPVLNISNINITTKYPGASPQVIEGYLSTPILKALSGIKGIDYITAGNHQGVSDITIQLNAGYDVTEALTNISTKVSSVKWKLPKAAFDPQIVMSPATTPVIFLGVSSKIVPQAAISNYITNVIIPQLEALPGVHDILNHAPRPLSMRIWLDPHKMAALNITPIEVQAAIKAQSLQAAVGKLKGDLMELDLSADTDFSSPDEFNNLIVANHDGHLIKIKDIGKAEFGPESYDVTSYSNGEQGDLIGIRPQQGIDDISVANEVLKMLPQLRSKLPYGLHVTMLWNTSNISKAAIKVVVNAAWEAIVCVLIVIFLFLGSIRSVLVPIVTIPFSLIGVCVFMYMLGYSINTLSLLGAVLAVGLVVDDAIVVLENIHRHIDEGFKPMEAAINGAREIAVPVIAMTFTVAVVFIPIGLMSGLTGALFHEFAFTVSGTVILSGIFALILSPMMCSKLLKKNPSQTSLPARIDRVCSRLATFYKSILRTVINIRYLVVILVCGIIIFCYLLFTHTPSELMPDEQQGVILGIGILPTQVDLNYSAKAAKAMADIFNTVKEAKSYGALVGWPNSSQVVSFIVLRTHQKGDLEEPALIKKLNGKLQQIPYLKAFAVNRPPLADVTGFNQPVEFVLQTTGSYEELYNVQEKIIAEAEKYPGLNNIQGTLKITRPAVEVNINRNVASDLGIPVSDITQTLNIILGEPFINWFALQGHSYPVIPQLFRKFRNTPEQLKDVKLRTANNNLVSLSNLVSFKNIVVPEFLGQFQQMRSTTIEANVGDGYTLGQALNHLENLAHTYMKKDMKYDFSLTSRYFEQNNGKMLGIFLFALIAIYLMLAAKFNSFIDPLIIMISVPLSMTGALIAMHMIGATLNIYTQIGLVMLIGLISKHGILIVNLANKKQEQGLSIIDAVVEAAAVRLRPILMTTAAMVFGSIPLLFAGGMGHLSLNQIGAVIIGGLVFGSCLTLFVVPTFYSFLARNRNTSKPVQEKIA